LALKSKGGCLMKALLLEKGDAFSASVKQLDAAILNGPNAATGDVTARIEYSTLNYKDGLAICNKGPVVRIWPMVAGIDAAGVILASENANWKVGDKFIHNGWGLGESRWGTMIEQTKLQGNWLVKLPPTFTTRQAMAIGTAGYTAMLCVMALERSGIKSGDVLVTGATGGVGSIAVALLSKLGYTVTAATGKASEENYLKSLGAAHIIDRNELSSAGKPFQKERWSGVVDAVGSHTLANALAQTRYGGVVAACGLAQGADLATTVMPFILRGVSLAGIDSVMAPLTLRQAAWNRLAQDLNPTLLESMIEEVPLEGAIAKAQQLMDGKVRGRIVVKI
jgi:acrylyl-CoA reductase (NADPH)